MYTTNTTFKALKADGQVNKFKWELHYLAKVLKFNLAILMMQVLLPNITARTVTLTHHPTST